MLTSTLYSPSVQQTREKDLVKSHTAIKATLAYSCRADRSTVREQIQNDYSLYSELKAWGLRRFLQLEAGIVALGPIGKLCALHTLQA